VSQSLLLKKLAAYLTLPRQVGTLKEDEWRRVRKCKPWLIIAVGLEYGGIKLA
jgi:hypothetical protein